MQVSMGDEGLSQCAANCDKDPSCIAYSMVETGLCTLLSALNVSEGLQAPIGEGHPRKHNCLFMLS
jgi:hypothetical protein